MRHLILTDRHERRAIKISYRRSAGGYAGTVRGKILLTPTALADPPVARHPFKPAAA
jgi:hypothetical protein